MLLQEDAPAGRAPLLYWIAVKKDPICWVHASGKRKRRERRVDGAIEAVWTLDEVARGV